MRVQVEGVSPQRHGNPESSKGKFDRESSFNRHGLNRSYHLRRSSNPPRESTPIRRLAGEILITPQISCPCERDLEGVWLAKRAERLRGELVQDPKPAV